MSLVSLGQSWGQIEAYDAARWLQTAGGHKGGIWYSGKQKGWHISLEKIGMKRRGWEQIG